MAPPEETPVPLPAAPALAVASNIVLQPPLSRRGSGPGLVLIVDGGLPLGHSDKTLDPPPLLKWAEEGFAVAQITLANAFGQDLQRAIEALDSSNECSPKGKYGLITYAPILQSGESIFGASTSIAAIVNYSAVPIAAANAAKPILWHAAGANISSANPGIATTHVYPEASENFVIPAHENYRSASAAVSHTRTLTFLKPLTEGPYFDLEAIWNEHCLYEFGERAVEKTMGTMVEEPYVNHIPTITGGIGRERLTNFYRNHFIHSNPPDTSLELVSRTVGVDRVIDEFVFKCTHDRVVDWLVPGIPPTGKPLEVPFTSIVNIRGDRLFHEHIAWDQATLLRQLGLLPEYLPFPYPVNGKSPAPGKKFEYRVPVAGVETARKLVDENSVQSNEMFSYGIREVDA
ncbi:carboxymethylenebutenolidase [Macrophomina phaseolina]|uniref:Carboxymethylenebutenolidase n=1 Tax=Macrophomina phaseolina TaxID=35725 RepID=A0ABQ8FWF5_9PEZI|nr:carboxymethylenebutenolidase [Macrophomina phaseolina]